METSSRASPSPERTPEGLFPRLARVYGENERRVAVSFFVAGFVFDVLTTGRIDSWLTIGQQAAYLAVITFALAQMLLEQGQPPREPPAAAGAWPRAVRFYFEYRTALLHFLLGALLSLYAIFFFKSSSLFASFGFLGVLVALLVANESARCRSLGLPFKFALVSLCWLSFAAAVVPIAIGSIGTGVFLLSMLAGAVPLAAVAWRLPGRRRAVLTPLGAVLAGFLLLYLFRVIPPVPLSIPFIGVYHGVERAGDTYLLAHERPWWKFWHHGDQDFAAQPGDRVFVYFRVFSPSRFSDQVQMRWFREQGGWKLQDTIPIRIVGGREAGFRGYGFKSNYEPGEWKVQIETTDGREIGRVYFDLAAVPAGPRNLDIDPD